MSKEKAASAAVLKYFEDQNRPYSTQDVFMNLHKEHGKPVIQRVIDQLVLDNLLKEKVNGKQKCYVINQENLPTASESELAALDAECAKLSEQLNCGQTKMKKNQARALQLAAEITTQEAVEQLEKVKSENVELSARLERLKGQGEVISAKDKKMILKNHEEMMTMWRKRKRMCSDILDAVLESWPKSKKDLYEEIGIETDEEAGVKMPKI